MITGIIIFLGLCFIGYAIFYNYHSTDPTKSTPMRILAAIFAGAAAIGAAIGSWFTTPPAAVG